MTETFDTWKLLVINPGSTSTKISLFENETLLFEESIFHDAPELLKYDHVPVQGDQGDASGTWSLSI